MGPEYLGKPTDLRHTGSDGRMFMEVVLWIACTSSPLRDLPPEFYKWNTVFKRFREWVKRDVFKHLESFENNGLSY